MTRIQIIVILGLVLPLLLCQAAWIFNDAKKNRYKHYWLWGLFGLLNVPESLIIYLIVTKLVLNKKNRPQI